MCGGAKRIALEKRIGISFHTVVSIARLCLLTLGPVQRLGFLTITCSLPRTRSIRLFGMKLPQRASFFKCDYEAVVMWGILGVLSICQRWSAMFVHGINKYFNPFMGSTWYYHILSLLTPVCVSVCERQCELCVSVSVSCVWASVWAVCERQCELCVSCVWASVWAVCERQCELDTLSSIPAISQCEPQCELGTIPLFPPYLSVSMSVSQCRLYNSRHFWVWAIVWATVWDVGCEP